MPQEAKAAAAKRLHDFEVEYDRTAFNAGAGGDEWVEPAPFDAADPLGEMYVKWAEAAVRAADKARGLKVERMDRMGTASDRDALIPEWRYVSDWQPVEQDR